MDEIEMILDNVENVFKDKTKIIEDMITITDDYYFEVSQQLPEIENDIDNTIEETKLLISYFINPEVVEDNNDEENYILKEIIFDLESKIKQAYESLIDKEEVFDQLSGFLGEDEGKLQFNQIIDLIKGLQGVLKNLKNLSINANIHAFKVGEKGAGFKVVSKEINHLSLKAEKKYEELEDRLVELRKWYHDFKKRVEEAVDFEEKIKNNFKGKIDIIMSDIISSLSSVSKLLKNFTDQINWAVDPIAEILILVQNQDIIKQNLENMIKIMESTQQETLAFENKDHSDKKNILNYLVFIIDVSQLSSKLMSNIMEQLDNSLFAIQEEFMVIENRLKEILEDNEFVIQFLVGKDKDQKMKDIILNNESDSSLKFIYEDILEFIPQFKNDLKEIGEKYNLLTDDRQEFNLYLQDISKQLHEIKKMATMISKIEIFAKIELSRINDDNNFIDSFETIIDKFVQTSQREQKIFEDLSIGLEHNYEDFMGIAEKNKKKLKLSSKSIDKSKEQLQITKKLIKEAIRALKENLSNFSKKIFKLNQEIEKCLDLEKTAKKVIKALDDINSQAVAEKEYYLSKIEDENWEKTNSHLEELITKFTSYVERKTANEEFEDFEIDVGGEEGELTLF